MKATRQQSIRRGVIATIAGVGAIALIAPVIASGSAVNTVGSGAAAQAVARPFIADLKGANETPITGDADGAGAAAVTINPTTGEICTDLRVSNIDAATAAHIHRGATGVAGPVVVTLTTPTPTSASCFTSIPLAVEISTTPADFYVNVHNVAFPGGAIRGQLAASTVLTGGIQLLAEPVRVYDSREGSPIPGPLVAGETRVISLASGKNGAGVTVVAAPPGAVAAMVRLTLDGTVNAGFVKLYSNALTAQPATSAINWYETGAIVGADATVAIDAEGKVKLTGGVNQTNVIIDVVGYVF